MYKAYNYIVLTCQKSRPVDSEPDYPSLGTPCSVKLPPGKQLSSGQGFKKGHQNIQLFPKGLEQKSHPRPAEPWQNC